MLRKFRVILEPNESGGYTVTVPLLPGCNSSALHHNRGRRKSKLANTLKLVVAEWS